MGKGWLGMVILAVVVIVGVVVGNYAYAAINKATTSTTTST